VGPKLLVELQGAGHETIAAPASRELDITNQAAVQHLILTSRPDAIAHLAAISRVDTAELEGAQARAVNVDGTANLMAAAKMLNANVSVLVTSSALVYGKPSVPSHAIDEASPTMPISRYGETKLAQERVALAHSGGSIAVAIARPFNHTGAGQRHGVVPELVRRVLAAREAGEAHIEMGDPTIERDFSDVRDVVVAYRLLLEGVYAGRVASGSIFNIASGKATSLLTVLDLIMAACEYRVRPRVRPDPARLAEPRVIR
jgi:GDP-4-dehydro-6-deoxy-D-mannose reductase